MKYIFFTSLLISFSSFAQQKLPKRITNISDGYPMQSPDGSKIVFQSNRTGNYDIYVMNSDGTGLMQLTKDPAPDNSPAWSPDGRKIVFASERNGKENDSEVYIMNADGSNQQRLTNQIGDDSHPKFAPDGKYIIFNSARSTPDLKAPWPEQWIEIFIMDTAGKNIRQLSSFKTISTFPSISPDGKKILYRKVVNAPAFNWDLSVNVRNRNSEVYVMNFDGTNDINISNSAAFDGWPAWSHDGNLIVFASNRTGPAGVGHVFVADAGGKNLRQVSNGSGGFVQPSFSADNRQVIAAQYWEDGNFEYGNLASFDL